MVWFLSKEECRLQARAARLLSKSRAAGLSAAQGLRPGAPGTPGTPGSAAPRLCLPQQVPLLAGCRGRRAGLSTQGPSQRLEVSRSRLGMPIGCPPPLSPRARRQGSALNAREMRSSPTFGGSACAREAHLWASAIDSICGNT